MSIIWRFENEFVQECASVLDETLSLLGCKDLSHSLFLVGINLETNDVCVIPDNTIVTSSDLSTKLKSIKEIYVPFYDDPKLPNIEWDQLYQKHDLSCWSCWSIVKDAVEKTLSNSDELCSISPCRVTHGYMVALVATYNKSHYERYPSLEMNIFTEHGRTPSLLFGAIEAVLDKFSDELRKSDAGGRYENDPPNASTILRTAGAFFTRVHAWAEKNFSYYDIQCRGTLELFDACNIISALPYESREGLGGMIIARIQHPAIVTTICLQKAIMADQHKRVRKLLELCKGDLSLLSDSRYIWGIGSFDLTKYEQNKSDIFNIKFVDNYHWELLHFNNHLKSVKNVASHLTLLRSEPTQISHKPYEIIPKNSASK